MSLENGIAIINNLDKTYKLILHITAIPKASLHMLTGHTTERMSIYPPVASKSVLFKRADLIASYQRYK